MNRERLVISTTWALRIILFLIFFLAATGKFSRSGNMMENFTRWDYPYYFMVIVGMIELAGSVLLLFPRYSLMAVALLTSIMIGSIVTHFLNYKEMGFPLFPFGLILSLYVIIYLKRLK